MYASVISLILLGIALAWTALNKSGIAPYTWYVSLVLIGLSLVSFWSATLWPKARRILPPSLPAWLIWTIRCLGLYLVFQAIPLPLALLSILSPARADFTRALSPVIGSVTAAPISVDLAAHILWALTLCGCAAVFFVVRALTFRMQNRILLSIVPVLAVAIFEAILGLLQVAGGAEEAVGSYNSRDHYCCILEMTLPLAIAFGVLFFNRRTDTVSIWPALQASACWFSAALLVLGVLFSLSRAGWIDSLAALLVLATLILFPRTPSTAWRLGILSGIVILAFGVFLIASPGAMLGRLAITLTKDSNGRLYIWQELLPLTKEFRWFGAGLMGFDPVFLKYQAFINNKRIDFAHNDFLQYLIELGIVGFLPLLLSLGGVVWPMAKYCWEAKSSSATLTELRLLLTGCLAGLAALFLHSLVDFNLYVPANMFAFAWILGFGSALAALMSLKMQSREDSRPIA